jgi:hypothetical protein
MLLDFCPSCFSRYKWSFLGWSLEYRLKFFELHWGYFLGFGLPSVTLSLIFPKFISLGLFALAFPIFIILAIIAKPVSHGKRRKEIKRSTTAEDEAAAAAASVSLPPPPPPVFLNQLPIFRGATWLNWCLLQRMQKRTRKSGAGTTNVASHVQPHVK